MNNGNSNLIKLAVRKILNYLCILLVVLQCRSWLMHINGLTIINAVTKIFIAVLLFAMVLIGKKYSLKRKELLFLFIYNLSMILLCLIHNSFVDIGFISNDIIIFSLFFVLLSTTDYKTVLKQFSDIIVVISLISLFFFVFATCLQVIKPTMRFISNWGGPRWINNYYFVYSEMQSLASFSYSGYRNTAIWVEGPMLAFPVCMALNYEVLLTEKPNKFRIGILLMTIITSFSTTGMILSIIILGIKFFVDNKMKKIFLWIVIPIAIIVMFWSIHFLLADKMLKSAISYNIHFDDISATLKCFCDNPFFGTGYNNVRGLVTYHHISAGLSTGLGGVLAYGGILWAVWYLVPFFISIRCFVKYKDLRDTSGFVIIFTILLALIIVQETALCMMFNAINWKLIFNMKGRLNES